MRLGVAANPRKPEALEFARQLIAQVGTRAEVVVSADAASVAPALPHPRIEEMRADLVVAIGGDGTFLYALGRTDAPILPVNAGTVGVLAEVAAHRQKEFQAAVERLLAGFFHIEERMKLAAEIDREPLPDATNDVVLHSAHVGRMAQFDVAVDGESTGRIRADGVIVATATGSTAYSLSSFGPIVDPGLDALVLTSIAPFRAEARAIVLEPLRTVTLRSIDGGSGAVVIVDGQGERPMPVGGTLTVYRSARRARIVRFGTSFFYRLRGKGILPWTEEASGGTSGDADLPPPT